jgi:mono/diheme cytochrome c family protein
MRNVALVVFVAGLLAQACYIGDTTSASPIDTAGGGGAAGAGGSTAGGGSGIDPATSGLPCEVAAVLARHCTGCHSSAPSKGVTGSLVTLDDLTKASKADPSQTVVALAIGRIRSGEMPPSPLPSPSETEIAALERWVAEGTPSAICASGFDAGTPATNPDDTPVQCSSGSHWTSGNRESPFMHPGGACITCHSRGEGPDFSLAGTVFPSAHEPDDCNGVGNSAGVTVVITDANGKVVELPVNAAGNFSYESSLALPYHAKVRNSNGERAMSHAQTSGDCNSCHTESGANDAPGRVMAP